MDIYKKKQNIKYSIFLAAVAIAFSALWYSGEIVDKLQIEERKKIELWAETIREIQEIPIDGHISPTLYKILESNKTIPVILVDENGNILNSMNLSIRKSKKKEYVEKELERMKNEHEPIVINFSGGHQNFVYYRDSILLSSLFYYPYIQIGVVILFVLVSYLAFSSSRLAEQNHVWVGMSKETAHQLGTPISSLLAWHEMLKMKIPDDKLLLEVEKDIQRLETITERFSGIGSEPVLVPADIIETIENSIQYLEKRTSKKVKYILNFDRTKKIFVPLNKSLFEWVLENMCKNAIDAMAGNGKIIIHLSEKNENLYIDIEDTGKGIPGNQLRTVFKPGFTTKKRGWGLGLSLAKRIVETYHKGKVFVKNSETDKGTTFRIILKKHTP